METKKYTYKITLFIDLKFELLKTGIKWLSIELFPIKYWHVFL